MSELSDAFVALPGGFGTIEEVVEAVTWTQLGIHAKPIGLLDVDGYYDHLVAFLDRAVDRRAAHARAAATLLRARRRPGARCSSGCDRLATARRPRRATRPAAP